jgi:copper chaperone
MITFQVKDMTCGHCVSMITKAVHTVDPSASVTTELGQHLVNIGSPAANAQAMQAAITEAGYSPVSATAQTAAEPTPSASGCCGGCH